MRNQFFGVDLRETDLARHLSLNQQLLLHERGEGIEEGVGPGREQLRHLVVTLKEFLLEFSNGLGVRLFVREAVLAFRASGAGLLLLRVNKDFIDLFDELVEAGQRLQQALRNQHTTVVLVCLGSVGNSVANAVYDVLECLSRLIRFL